MREATACGYTEYVDGEVPEGSPKTGVGATGVEADIWDALYGIEDSEMPVSVVDLGFIYNVRVVEREDEDDETKTLGIVEMTLTYTGCPTCDYLENDVQCAILAVGVDETSVRPRFTPEWAVNMVTEADREALHEFGLGVQAMRRFDPSTEATGETSGAECPHCSGTNTVHEHPKGPGLCRSMHFCNDCQEPFQQFE